MEIVLASDHSSGQRSDQGYNTAMVVTDFVKYTENFKES